MNTTKVCYIIYGEEIWSPLIRRQVVELLETIVKLNSRLTIRLVYIIPWYWSFTKRKKLAEFLQTQKSAFIELKIVRIPYPFPFPYFLPKYVKGRGFRPHETHSGYTFWLVQLIMFPILIKYILIDRYQIFHSRSYRASALLLPVSRLMNSVKFVFDPRSDYPEEQLIQSNWKRTNFSYRYWKKQERNILKYAATTICISEYYQLHYQTIYPNFVWNIVPNNVDCARFRLDLDQRSRIRTKYKIQNKLVFCYLGTMSKQSWHNPAIYAHLVNQFTSATNEYVFLFLVPQGARATLETVFDKLSVQRDNYLVVSPNYDDVPKYLSAADYGLLYLGHPKIALGTKIVEYNAMGLPVLVNSNIISAARHVEKYRSGKVINMGLGGLDTTKTSVATIDFSALCQSYSRASIARETALVFSNETVAQSYIDIYYRLASTIK